jgi:hypothetical protein
MPSPSRFPRRDKTGEDGAGRMRRDKALDVREDALHPRHVPFCFLIKHALHVDAQVEAALADPLPSPKRSPNLESATLVSFGREIESGFARPGRRRGWWTLTHAASDLTFDRSHRDQFKAPGIALAMISRRHNALGQLSLHRVGVKWRSDEHSLNVDPCLIKDAIQYVEGFKIVGSCDHYSAHFKSKPRLGSERRHAAPGAEACRNLVISVVPATLGRVPGCKKSHQQRRGGDKARCHGSLSSSIHRLHRICVHFVHALFRVGGRQTATLRDEIRQIFPVGVGKLPRREGIRQKSGYFGPCVRLRGAGRGGLPGGGCRCPQQLINGQSKH